MHMKDTPSPVWACCWAAHPWLPGSSCPPALWAWTWWWDDPSSTFSHNPPLGKATERIGWNDTHRHKEERNNTLSCGCCLHVSYKPNGSRWKAEAWCWNVLCQWKGVAGLNAWRDERRIHRGDMMRSWLLQTNTDARQNLQKESNWLVLRLY